MRSSRFPAMGTEIHVLVPEEQRTATTLVRDLFVTWERRLSRFRPESELSRLNARAGEPVVVSPLLFAVVRASVDAARATDGAFDPTLLRHMARIGYDRSFSRMPLVAPTTDERARPGGAWRQIVLDARTRVIALPRGCALDLGGIAKGMAVDAAIDLLGEHGVDAALVSAGGDLAVRGRPPGARAWGVVVGETGAQVVPLARGALATSGVARRSWRQGEIPRHHIVDPGTGEPAESGLREVTVAAGTCTAAEVGATAGFVLGPRHGADFLRRNGLVARLTRHDGAHVLVGQWPAPLPEAA